MIRLVLCSISLTIFAIVMIPVGLVCLLIRKWRYKAAHSCVQFCLRIEFRICLWLSGCKLTVKGIENVPKEAVLFIANHRGVFDIVAGYATLPNITAFVAKNETRFLPLAGQMVGLLGGLFLNREDIRQGLETIMRAIDYIKDGVSIWIFPEGTRQKKGEINELLPFHAGSFKVATKTGAPVVPVLFTGTREAFEDHKPWVRPSNITVTYGAPVYTDELSDEDRKHIGEYFRQRIIDMNTPSLS